jgi:hypothetical protein
VPIILAAATREVIVPRTDDDHHCPFLNRADERCSPHFHVDALDHAYAFCFGRYKLCPHYLELLVERRVRRLTAGVASPAARDFPGTGSDGNNDPDHDRPARDRQSPPVFVPLTVQSAYRAA